MGRAVAGSDPAGAVSGSGALGRSRSWMPIGREVCWIGGSRDNLRIASRNWSARFLLMARAQRFTLARNRREPGALAGIQSEEPRQARGSVGSEPSVGARPRLAPPTASGPAAMLSKLLPANEHPLERALRVLLGLGLLSLVFLGPKTPWGWIGLVPLATGLLGSCPLYTLLGISTCPLKRT